MNNKFGPEEAAAWLKVLEDANEEALTLFKCSVWALDELSRMRQSITGNVVSIKASILTVVRVRPWPDPKGKNFKQLGEELDRLIRKLNADLPGDDSK